MESRLAQMLLSVWATAAVAVEIAAALVESRMTSASLVSSGGDADFLAGRDSIALDNSSLIVVH